jgi:PASTA domain-containing protein
MSDDEEQRRSDETGEFFPFADESENKPNDGPRKDDRTELIAPVPAAGDDATQVTPRAPQGDGTAVLPSASDSGTGTERYNRNTANWADEEESVWAGRAGVRPPRPGMGDEFARTGWDAEPAPEETRGKWWTPIVVGIVTLILLAVLGWGVWLIVQSTSDDTEDPTPAVTTSAAAPAPTKPAAVPPSVAPTTAAPTTTAPSSSPSDITVPALKGLSTDEARAALNRMGLSYRLRFVPSDAPSGTVIDSDPPEGQKVPADTVIALVIAAERTTSATPEPTPTTEPTDGPDED